MQIRNEHGASLPPFSCPYHTAQGVKMQARRPAQTAHADIYPRATSRIIITKKPPMTPRVPTLECSPRWASGISSSTTT